MNLHLFLDVVAWTWGVILTLRGGYRVLHNWDYKPSSLLATTFHEECKVCQRGKNLLFYAIPCWAWIITG